MTFKTVTVNIGASNATTTKKEEKKKQNTKITTTTTTKTTTTKAAKPAAASKAASSTKWETKTVQKTNKKEKAPKKINTTNSRFHSSNNRQSEFTSVSCNPATAIRDIKNLHWNKIRIAFAILLFIICILDIVSLASPVWLNFNGVQTQGLWRVCFQDEYGNELICDRYEKLPGNCKSMIIKITNITIFLYKSLEAYLKVRQTF